jgi:hypothetical protein
MVGSISTPLNNSPPYYMVGSVSISLNNSPRYNMFAC